MALTVRMYEVGFGDCFLIGVHDPAPSRWILIDCGSITEGKAKVRAVVDDILAMCRNGDGNPELALVIATHRHKDHVWGFDDPRWADVLVGEVWMPWTEDPADPRAIELRGRQAKLALALAVDKSDENPLELTPANETVKEQAVRALRAIALNALTNEAAMKTLHEGFKGSPPRMFLPEPDQVCQARTVGGVAGVVFHVLGPPRGDKALALMDPPEGAGYLRWPTRIPPRQVDPPFSARYRIVDPAYLPTVPGATFRQSDKKEIEKALEEPDGFLGLALDKAINNTSLVIMIEAGEHHLLFTGDAQWGSWQAILAEPQCRALLERMTLLKVGHHGSHNATPRALIEDLAPKPITALISTKPVKQWPGIPRPPLIDALGDRHDRIGRTDRELQATAAGFSVGTGLYVEWTDQAPARKPRRRAP